MHPIKILVASDCSVFRNSFVAFLQRHDEMKMIGEVADPWSNRSMVLQADILVFYVPVLNSDIIETLRKVYIKNPGTKALIATGLLIREEFIVEVLQWGARGFLLNPCQRETSPKTYQWETCVLELLQTKKAIHAINAGEIWMGRKTLAHVLEHMLQNGNRSKESSLLNSRGHLTARECEIAASAAQGLSNKEIAKRLRVSDKTIKKHLERIYSKLGIHRRTQLRRDSD